MIESVPFLKEGGPDFITLITNSLTFDVFLPGDVIIKEGALGNEMYFIRNGIVDIEVEGYHITTLSEGDYFGGMNCSRLVLSSYYLVQGLHISKVGYLVTVRSIMCSLDFNSL